jgi:ATP-binding cassette subfamily F protein uup
MIDTISNTILALDGYGNVEYFADYAQWEANRGRGGKKGGAGRNDKQASKIGSSTTSSSSGGASGTNGNGKGKESKKNLKPLSNNEKKELEQIGSKVEEAESALANVRKKMEDPAVSANHVKLAEMMQDYQAAETTVAKVFARWEELEARRSASEN